MGTEQLYFIIGFLLATLIVGCVSVLAIILYNEWFKLQNKKQDDNIFDWRLIRGWIMGLVMFFVILFGNGVAMYPIMRKLG